MFYRIFRAHCGKYSFKWIHELTILHMLNQIPEFTMEFI
jgi:hypothetical protein